MAVRESILAIFQDSSLGVSPKILLADILETMRYRIMAGRVVSSNGGASRFLDFAAGEDLTFSAVKACRFDESQWNPVLVIAFKSPAGNCLVSVLRIREEFYFGFMRGNLFSGFHFCGKSAEGEKVVESISAAVWDYFSGLNWSEDAFDQFGSTTSIGVLSNRMHDGLYAFGEARIACRKRLGANFVVLNQGGLLNPCQLPSFELAEIKRVEWGEVRALRDDMAISWIESLCLPIDEVRAEMQRVVSELVEATTDPAVHFDGDLIVFVSYEAEKRSWLEQEEGLGLLCTTLCDRYQSVHLLLNGMTAPAEGADESFFREIRNAENEFLERLRRSNPSLKTTHLFGMTVAEKICFIKQSDFFIGPAISAVLLPLFIGVPGVVYGNSRMLSQFEGFLDSFPGVIRVPYEMVDDDDKDHAMVHYDWAKGSIDGTSYHIDPSRFVELSVRHLLEVCAP